MNKLGDQLTNPSVNLLNLVERFISTVLVVTLEDRCETELRKKKKADDSGCQMSSDHQSEVKLFISIRIKSE